MVQRKEDYGVASLRRKREEIVAQIGEAEIAALKPGSFIVNVARGEIIDENALIESLKSGHIAGAGLDVTEEEPLPPDNSLWTLPCVILSPHVAGGGAGEGGYRRQKDLFAANLQRLEKRQTLLSLVDTASTAQVPVTETRPP